MKTSLTFLLIAIAFAANGCSIRLGSSPHVHYPDPEPQIENYPRSTGSDYQARIDAAKSIININTRDKAFSAIAIDAAYELKIEFTIQALSKIVNINTKDETAGKCVEPFIQENMNQQAREITNKITNINTRDKVLTKIALGPVDSL